MNNNISYLKTAYYLSVFTIVYNIAEGIISVAFGYKDETLTLFGFGIDSFIETISASGIFYMVINLKRGSNNTDNQFEKRALRITGWSFYILAAGLVTGALITIVTGEKPHSTIPGVIISLFSIVFMIYLVSAKRKVGKAIHSDALISDANCNLVCIYMSVILLISSVIYEVFHIGYIDAAGTLGLAFFSIREGKEALQKVKTGKCACDCNHNE